MKIRLIQKAIDILRNKKPMLIYVENIPVLTNLPLLIRIVKSAIIRLSAGTLILPEQK